jgi:hypothetical protein
MHDRPLNAKMDFRRALAWAQRIPISTDFQGNFDR